MNSVLTPALAVLFLLLSGCSPGPDRATVHRDEWGVPHIYADTEEAGFYALGYAMAEDRPERTLGLVAWARGTLAAVVGPNLLEWDLNHRLWRHAREGDAGVERLSPEVRRNYAAFVAGLRSYFTQNPEAAGAYSTEVGIGDYLSLIRALYWAGYQAADGARDCGAGRFAYGSLESASASPPSGAAVDASNGWLVMPERSASGSLILLADPHVENGTPFYYEFRMHAGRLHTAGFAAGPLLWQVFTPHVSWAMTTGHPDVVDCYEVELDPANPRRYRYDDTWREMITHNERIEVEGGEAVEVTFDYTEHNGVLSPVLARRDGKAFVASTPSMHQAGLLSNELYRMNLAQSVDEVKQAMTTMSMLPQNLIVGDSAGNALYVRAGRSPIRPAGYDWTAPVPGNTSATAWLGVHSFDDLVQLQNPTSAFLQNNNSAPDTVVPAADAPPSANDYPPWLFNDLAGRLTPRGRRALDVLGTDHSVTVDEAKALATDQKWVTAMPWTEALRSAAELRPATTAEASALLERLTVFDGVAAKDSTAAAAHLLWRSELAALAAERSDVPPLLAAFDAWPEEVVEVSAALASVLVEAVERTAAAMLAAHGTTEVALGEIYRIRRRADTFLTDAPAGVDYPIGGVHILTPGTPGCLAQLVAPCDATLRAFTPTPWPGDSDRFEIRSGSQSLRLVVLSDPIEAYTVYAFGQSDHPSSPHYDDQTQLLSAGRLKPVYFTEKQLAGHIESTTTLVLPAELASAEP